MDGVGVEKVEKPYNPILSLTKGNFSVFYLRLWGIRSLYHGSW